MKELNLYFIAIIPPQPLFDKINAIKEYIADKYICKQALKSPPHITFIPPFQLSSKKEQELLSKVHYFNHNTFTNPVQIQINSYDVFLPKVVFINVINTAELSDIQKKSEYFFHTHFDIKKDLTPRPFHPHITIAFRDIKKTITRTISEDLKTNFPVNEIFYAQNISLLKHDGKHWNIIS